MPSTRDSDSSASSPFRYLAPAQERQNCPKIVKIPFAQISCRLFCNVFFILRKSQQILRSCLTTAFQFSLRFDVDVAGAGDLSSSAWCIFRTCQKIPSHVRLLPRATLTNRIIKLYNKCQANILLQQNQYPQSITEAGFKSDFPDVIGFLRCYICW